MRDKEIELTIFKSQCSMLSRGRTTTGADEPPPGATDQAAGS